MGVTGEVAVNFFMCFIEVERGVATIVDGQFLQLRPNAKAFQL